MEYFIFKIFLCNYQINYKGTQDTTELTAENSDKLDLAFLIHTSEDIDYDKYDYYTKFMHDTVSEADINSGDVRVGAVIYNAEAKVVFPLDENKDFDALWRSMVEFPLEKSSDANLANGMDTVREELFTPSGGDRPDVPNAVIVVTDADSNIDQDKIAPAADKLKDKAKIFTAGVGLKGMSQLPTVATAPAALFTPDTVEDLPPVRDPIVDVTPACKEDNLHDRCQKCIALTYTRLALEMCFVKSQHNLNLYMHSIPLHILCLSHV